MECELPCVTNSAVITCTEEYEYLTVFVVCVFHNLMTADHCCVLCLEQA